jgi:hypothetical protein
MSEKTAKGVEEANDAMARLSGFLTSSFRRAIAELAPAITEITNGIRAWVEMKVKEEGGIGAVAKKMASSIILSAIKMVESFEMITNGFITMVNKIQQALPSFLGGFRSLSEVSGEIAKKIDYLEGKDLAPRMRKGAVTELQKLLLEYQGLVGAGREIQLIDFDSTNGLLWEMYKAINSTNKAASDLKETLGGDEGIFQSLKKGLVDFKTEFETVWDDMNTKHEDIFTRMGEKAADIFGPGGTFSQSIGDATAKMVVYGEKSDITMKKIGQSILSNVVSSLVTEGVQMAVNWVKKKAMALWEVATDSSIKSSQTATSLAAIGATTTASVAAGVATTMAWTPAATMVSLATFGANAAPAMAGITATTALAMTSAQMAGLPSAEGGGFTGTGSRSGGVDGKGGFLSILHPKETVIDHTKGQKAGGVVENTIVNNTDVNFTIVANDTAGFDSLLSERRGLIISMINEAMNDRGQRGLA